MKYDVLINPMVKKKTLVPDARKRKWRDKKKANFMVHSKN